MVVITLNNKVSNLRSVLTTTNTLLCLPALRQKEANIAKIDEKNENHKSHKTNYP